MRKVTKITSKINLIISDSITEKIELPTNEKIITTPIWLKLLATRIVAKSFFGFCNNFEITFAFVASCLNSMLRSFWVNENMATSAAETIAEQNKKKTIAKMPKTVLKSILAKKLILGSGSNEWWIS